VPLDLHLPKDRSLSILRMLVCRMSIGRPSAIAFFLALSFVVTAAKSVPLAPTAITTQSGKTKKKPATQPPDSATPRISLSPRFLPGQVFRYVMEFETTTATSRSGIAHDAEGPSSLVVTWDATVRMEVLPAADNLPGGIRLRTTYEKSGAALRSDTFDPTAAETQEQYRKLEGKVVEFTLDAAGKIVSVSGIEGITEGDKASQAARQWIAQLDASSGAPPGGVTIGQKWSTEQPASSLPLAGMAWRSDTEYLRDEPCNPPNPDVPASAAATGSTPHGKGIDETCAVLLTHLNLVRPKPVRDPTPEEYRKNGVTTAGKWEGSGQSLIYVSLRTGTVISITQTGLEEMDVTLTSNRKASMHYDGTIQSRSQVALVANDNP
jgi:hypothetical protein